MLVFPFQSGGAGRFANSSSQSLDGRDVRDSVGTTSNSLAAGLAVPDTDGVALDVDLAAEGASVLGVLCDFHLLHLLTQGSTVSVRENFPSAFRSPLEELRGLCICRDNLCDQGKSWKM